MTTRRIIVWIVSTAFGAICTVGIIAFFGTTLKKFMIGNALLVFLSTGSLAFIWLDYLLRTKYLRS